MPWLRPKGPLGMPQQERTNERLFDARVRVVTGKGGTGKSTVALALAMLAQQRGKKVLLCELNPAKSLARFLRAPALPADPVSLAEHLWGVALVPHDAMREYALMILKFKALYNAVFENRLVRYFLRAVPSLGEFVTMGKLWFHEQEQDDDGAPKYDLIVVDAPASGHLLSWLRVPHVFLEMLPAGPLTSSSRDFLAMLQQRTRVDIVTLPEEMPVNEAIEIDHAIAHGRLAQRGLTFINRVLGPLPPGLSPALLAATDVRLQPLAAVVQNREHWRALGEHYVQRLPADALAAAIRLARREPPSAGAAVFSQIAAEIGRQL